MWYAGVGRLSFSHTRQSEFLRDVTFKPSDGQCGAVYAGAGINRSSDPEQEWREMNNKAAGLRALCRWMRNESHIPTFINNPFFAALLYLVPMIDTGQTHVGKCI